MTDLRTKLDLIDGLRRFQDDFDRDFSLRDMGALCDCFSKEELVEITNLSDEKEKIDKLLFTFIYIKKDPMIFVHHLLKSYRWLYDSIVNCHSRGDKWISDYRKAIQDVPNNQDWNIHRTKYLWRIQKDLKNLQRNNYLILFGKLGFGKRWLVVDACRDYGVISKMNFKIFWLNVSKCRTQELVLQKMHRLKVLLQADDLDIKYNVYSGNTKNEIIHMRNHLRKILEQPEFRDCLIVLTDVQDEQIIKAFDLKCKILLTTRHIEKLDEIPTCSKTTINIDEGFTTPESSELFVKAFNSPLPSDMPTYVEKFHAICNGHPFIMSLIAKSFQQFSKDVKDRKLRCDNWLKNLNNYKLQNIDDHDIEESLKLLSPDHRICYKKMVIFTDNSDIPFTVLEKIWDKDSQQTEEIVMKLYKYSLIEKSISDDTKACSLHYLHFHILKQHVPKETQTQYHQHLIAQYEIEKVLQNRKNLDLNFPNDNYFHYFIPYHLVGANKVELFDLYFDFGFLEQKMRITQLVNTVGDMRMFEKEITRNDPNRKEFLKELIDFLTNNEQLIFKSLDVNLLQCALTSYGSVQKKAQEQIQHFKDRVWMDDVNHEENQTQIVQLPETSPEQILIPNLVRFVKPSENLFCLISLQDNNILMHDIKQDYSDHPVIYRNELTQSVITDMQVFRNQAFLTLNDQGKLSVYTLKPNPPKKASGPNKLVDSHYSKVLQRLDNVVDKITCFTVLEQQEAAKLEIDLMIGTCKGDIKFYQWRNNKFEETSVKIRTEFNGLFRMARILDYAMLLNNRGEIKFINFINSGEVGANRPWQPLECPINLHQGMCIHCKRAVSICVSKNKVVQVTHSAERKVQNFVFVDYDEVFVANDEFDDNKILSSTMSKDAEYLILGTTKGIIVIDRFHKKVIFRRNVSDQVLSLDIYRYHDEALYILSSVFKDAGPIINLYGFYGNRDDPAIMSGEMIIFVGEDLFDVRKSDDDWQLVAVDTKRIIHYRSSADGFTNSFEKYIFQFQIKKMFCNGDNVIVGCTNGEVLSTNRFNQTTALATLMSEITYLECFGDVTIASCSASFKLISSLSIEFYGKLAKAFRYKEGQLLLVKKNCAIEVLDIQSGKICWSKLLVDDATCSAQAYCDGLVVIGTISNTLLIWQVNEEQDAALELKTVFISSPATFLAISYDKSVLAVGFLNGAIEIYELNTATLLKKLESHKRPIMNLQFSPWTNSNDPLILLSLSESVNFWNIRSIQNNPLDLKKKIDTQEGLRVSQRFKSPLKIIPTMMDTLLATDNLTLNESHTNPWHGKTGSSDKPELLSCIKLVAKSAKRIIYNEDFTRFVTIDNEGNVYHLRLIDETSDSQLPVDYNGNPLPRLA